jgi:hypothetical protein
VIAYQSESTALRKYSSFLANRTVLKTIDEMCGHAIATSDLSEVTFGYSVADQIPQYKKTVDFAFGMMHG